MTTYRRSPNLFDIALFTLFIMLLCLIFSSCKTSHEVTRLVIERDSTSQKVRDSASEVITELKQKHILDIESIKNTGVTFQPNCDTIIIDAHCNYDSVQRLIVMLKNRVTINAAGAITAEGKLSGAYANLDSKQHELSEKDSVIQVLQFRHESDSSAIKSLTDSSHTVDKSKPGGIFSGFWMWSFLVLFLIAAGLYIKERFIK